MCVEFTMLGVHQSDPPDAPSLQEAGDTLFTFVDSGSPTMSSDQQRKNAPKLG